jgi:hypothetical protein
MITLRARSNSMCVEGEKKNVYVVLARNPEG